MRYPTFREIRRASPFNSRDYDASIAKEFQKYLEEKWWVNRVEAMKQLGYALMYMDYLYPSWGPKAFRTQKPVVLSLCREFAASHKKTSPRFWARFRQKVELETENMC